MDTLPPLDAVDETPLAQMATLKTQLQEDPDSLTSAQHGQLRALAGMIREWVKDYESAKAWKNKEEDSPWLKILNTPRTPPALSADEQHEKNMKDIAAIKQRRNQQTKPGSSKYPLPDNLPTIKKPPDTCTN